jgi:hypothetical protein
MPEGRDNFYKRYFSLRVMVDYWKEIDKLREELSKTKYNKSTEGHIGLVKAKIAQLKEKAIARSQSGGSHEGYAVRRSGDGTVILIGFPSSGKSTLLNAITGAESETAGYAFTTLDVIPGTLEYEYAKIQILDVPGIVEGAASGRGRGKEVLSCVRSADLCVILVDVNKPEEYNAIKQELREAGIRVDEHKPFVKITRKPRGGIVLRSTVKLTKMHPDTIRRILREFKYNNCEVIFREDINVDQLIDVIEGNRKYLPSITLLNKIDLVKEKRLEEVKKRIKPDLCVSAKERENIEELKRLIFEKLDFIRVFMKEPGKDADLEEPMIMKKGSTIKQLCEKVHREMVKNFRFARVWGPSAKFPGQRHSLDHTLRDKDIVEIKEN